MSNPLNWIINEDWQTGRHYLLSQAEVGEVIKTFPSGPSGFKAAQDYIARATDAYFAR